MHPTSKLAAACLLLVLCWLLSPSPLQAQGPDFSGEDDILNGQTHLLRADDVFFAYADNPTSAPFNNSLSNNFVLFNNGDITQQQALTVTSVTAAAANSNAPVAAARMFDLPQDVTVVLVVRSGAPQQPDSVQLSAIIFDYLNNSTLSQAVAVVPSASAASLVPLGVATADFSGDGFDDLAISYTNAGQGQLAVLRATDPGNWLAGVTLGPVYTSTAAYVSLAAPDVDGDSQPEIAGVSNGTSAVPTSGQMEIFGVDPQTLAVTAQATTALGAAGLQNEIAAGDYDGNPNDDEVAIVVSGDATVVPALQLYDFPARPPVGTLLDQANVRDIVATGVEIASGPVHWFGAGGDAILVAAKNANAFGGGDYLLSVFTVAQNKLVLQATHNDGANVNLESMALGRFDTTITNGAFNPDLQLIALTDSDIYGDDAYGIWLLSFGTNGSGYAVTSTLINLLELPGASTISLATGDLQGHSLRLGAPNKITINGHNAPSTVIGSPPMHLDWVTPSCADPNYPNNCTTPQVVGILAKPASNYAQLNTQIKGGNQSSSQKTTSYSLATKESVSAKVSYGIPDIFSVSSEIKDSASQTYKRSVATTSNAYSSVSFDASVRTGFADHVWFDHFRFNIWTYPVIGKTVCPASIPNCTAAQQVPMHMQFSGPDQINTYDLDGNVLEWYQPLWEPGNLLSYPWTLDQLQALLGRSTVVNKSDVWAADTSGSNASVTWSQGGGQDVSQGSTKSYSNDTSISVSASASIAGFGIGGSAAFDASTSSSTQTLNTSSTTHGSSTGFTVAKTAQGVDDYIFAAQTLILGQAPLTGTLQTLPVTATVQTAGPLRLAYWSNPYDSVVGGAWWNTAYSLPDVALNHPQRWTWTTSPLEPNKMTFNHVVTTTSPFDQEFYMMRGLYITSQGAPDGPQLTTAAVTETVLLQARVYNYSHVDMNAASLAQAAAAVKVRFYGQLFDSDSGTYPKGSSFLIGEQTLPPLPGYASTTTPGDVPNWTLAVQPFTPSAFAQTQAGNHYLRFWVVVWMEDAAGSLVTEMAGHGLSANPRLQTITTMGDVGVEGYSNNVGSLKQVFYVSDPKAEDPAREYGRQPVFAVATMTTVTPAPGSASLPPHGKHQVTITVHNGSEAMTPLHLLYFEGDPAQGGRLFDWEMIPHVDGGARIVNSVTYTPQTCGAKTIYIVAQTQGSTYSAQSQAITTAPCLMILPWIGRQ